VEIFQGGIEMLVLSRRQEEVIVIGEDIEIMIVRIGPNSVRVGIKAPRDLIIVRKELIDGSQTDVAETQIEAAV
jgi:carbon storage regulator